MNLFIGGLYNQYKVNFALAGGGKQDTTVNTYMVGAGGKYAYGPFYFNAEGQYGKNPNNGDGFVTLIPSVMAFDPTTNKSEDSEYWAGQGVIGFKLSDMISFEGGYVYQYGKVKDPSINQDFEQTTGIWYVQSVISPAKNFYIVPEIGDIDYQNLKVAGVNTKLGDLLWFGIKWQINF